MSTLAHLKGLLARMRPNPVRGYAICTSPRSGSNYLCQLLTSTGKLGAPLEYFNGSSRRIFEDPAYPDDRNAQIAKILGIGATPNNVYALKLFFYQHEAVCQSLDWPNELPSLKYVYLNRNDRIGQAISWARAEQTGQYRASQCPLNEARYDAAQIINLLNLITREQQCWERYFAAKGISPLRVAYEDVVANPQKMVSEIAKFVGIRSKCEINGDQMNILVQSDASSSQWRAKFARDYPDLADCAAATPVPAGPGFSSGGKQAG